MPNQTSPPKSFWIVAAVALVWNLMGVAAYIMQVTMSDEAMAALPEAQQLLHASTPAWATAAYALAVHGGALASLMLLLRRAWAIPLFALSLASLLVQMGHAVFLSDAIAVLGPGALAMPIVVTAAGVFLFLYARSAKARGYLS